MITDRHQPMNLVGLTEGRLGVALGRVHGMGNVGCSCRPRETTTTRHNRGLSLASAIMPCRTLALGTFTNISGEQQKAHFAAPTRQGRLLMPYPNEMPI